MVAPERLPNLLFRREKRLRTGRPLKMRTPGRHFGIRRRAAAGEGEGAGAYSKEN